MANNYKIICSDYRKNRNYKLVYTYYFESLEQAEKAKKAIIAGGNKAVIKEV